MRKAGAAPRGTEGRGLRVIAVLPFANFARTPDSPPAASIAEDLGRQLSRAPGFRVVVQAAVVATPIPTDPLTSRGCWAASTWSAQAACASPSLVCVSPSRSSMEKMPSTGSQQQDLAPRSGNADVDDFVAGEPRPGSSSSSPSPRRERARVATTARTPGTRCTRLGSALYSAGWSEDAVDAAVRLYREAIASIPSSRLHGRTRR